MTWRFDTFLRFLNLLVSRDPLAKSKNHEICEIWGFDFLNCESACDLTDDPVTLPTTFYNGSYDSFHHSF